jgi:hypothetical protein
MRTILRSGPYRFYFQSQEPNEPLYVHITRDKASCKVWLSSVPLASSLVTAKKDVAPAADQASIPNVAGPLAFLEGVD